MRVGAFRWTRTPFVAYTPAMQAILFDANGVLYFRAGRHEHFRAFLRDYRHAALTADEVWQIRDRVRRRLRDTPRTEIQAAILAAAGVADPAALAAGHAALAADDAAITLFPDVRETLAQLAARGFRLGVVTNTAVTSAEKLCWLQAQQLDVAWQTFVASSEVGVRKPAPRIYELALAECAAAPSAAVFVGHSAKELAGARAVGLYTIGVAADPCAQADVLLGRLRELLDLPLLARPG